MKTYGLIFSAGNESRFEDDYPKCFSMWEGKSFLDRNIEELEKYCDRVVVVTSLQNESFFGNYDHIAIDSGKGCGDAVMKAIQSLSLAQDDMIYIQWGDCLCQVADIIHETVDCSLNNRVIIPCVFENNPYVSIYKDDLDRLQVLFSKYGEYAPYAYHDFGTFYANADYLLKHLQEFSDNIKHNNSYHHKHGNEMQFLDVFNETNILGHIIEVENRSVISFNSMKDLLKISDVK